MLLSRRYQFLFVHIAKTGGTSVRNALQRYRWRDPYYLPQWISSKLSGAKGHSLGIATATLQGNYGSKCSREVSRAV